MDPKRLNRERNLQLDSLSVAGPNFRTTEIEWRRTHPEVLRNYAGQWVVLENDQIVAYGAEPGQVVAEARARGVPIPYLFYVEAAEGPERITMGL